MRHINIGSTIKRLQRKKWVRWSAFILVGTCAFTQHHFRTDPFSYFRYSIRSITFTADEFQRRLPRSSREFAGEVKFSKDGQFVFLQRNTQNRKPFMSDIMRWESKTGRKWVTFGLNNNDNPLVGPDVTNFTVSDDERWFVTSSRSDLVTLWNNQDDLPERVYEVPIEDPAIIYRLAISPRSDRIAVTGPGDGYWNSEDVYESTLVVIDAASGEIVRTIYSDSLLYDTAFSPDSKTIATIHRNNKARLWDATTGKEIYQLDLEARYNISKKENFISDRGRIGFSADGATLITSDDFSIQIWQATTGELLHTLKDGTNGFSMRGSLDLDGDFAVSPDGKWLAASKPPSFWNPARDNRIYLWNVQTGRLVRTFIPNTLNPYNASRIRNLDFSPDGKQLVGNDDLGRITVWSLPNQLSFFE